MADAPALTVRGLTVSYPGLSGWVDAVRGVDFDWAWQTIGLVGESGSGKTTVARTLAGLLPPLARWSADTLRSGSRDLVGFTRRDWTRWRGAEVASVLQDAKGALNPVLRAGQQVEESLLLHGVRSSRARREAAREGLRAVGLEPERVYASFPHQLSGGQAQRVMVAAALAASPRFLVADEPTSALDADLRDSLLELLTSLTVERGMGLLVVTHDLSLVVRHLDEGWVMRRGQIVDRARGTDLAQSPHPYTQALWRARPSGRTHGLPLAVYAEGVDA